MKEADFNGAISSLKKSFQASSRSFTHITGPDSPVIDPQQDREPPPLPTVVLFPHEELHTDKSWPRHPPDLYNQYTNVNKPYVSFTGF
jgi:hypothetical protein